MSEELTYNLTLSFDEQGVPERIPVPVFIEQDMLDANVRFVGDTNTHILPFSDNAAFTVTITVVSAAYTPTSADAVLEIDVFWIGEYASITAAGTHTLQTRVVANELAYSSLTHYDAHLAADDDWDGDATEDFDCTGTLTPR
jgi:hypothetical protein